MADVLVERTSLTDAADAIREKLGTHNLIAPEDFAENIMEISGGSEGYVAPYGNLEYYPYGFEWSLESDWGYEGTFTVEIVDMGKFQDYLVEQYPCSQYSRYYHFRWTSSEQGGNDQWELEYESEYGYQRVTLGDDEYLENEYGIQVSWETEEWERKYEAAFDVRYDLVIRTDTAAGIRYINTDEEYGTLSGEWSEEYQTKCVLGDIPYNAIKSFTFGESTTHIPDHTLYGALNLESVDMSRANRVTVIGNDFLRESGVENLICNIPSGVTAIPNHFLSYCAKLGDTTIEIPNTVTSIGSYFCGNNAYSHNPGDIAVTIPSSVTSIGNYFMYQCWNISSITVNTTNTPTDLYSLACNSTSASSYTNGITVYGSGRSSWLTNLPNRTSNPYRKLIDGEA